LPGGKLDSVDQPHVDLRQHSRRPKPGALLRPAGKNRYHFYAKFTKNNGWVVQAALRLEYRVFK
jgi:hypothetical protein